MSKRNKKRRPARRRRQLDVKPLILIVCEGKVTEKQYLEALHRLARQVLVEIDVRGGKGVPKTLVQRAKQYREERKVKASTEKDINLQFDQVWCVFDIDDHPNLPDAVTMADANGIQLAISNPCIELWLLLHFTEPPGNYHRDKVRQLLKKHIPNYDKHIDIAALIPQYALAVKRAERLALRKDDVVEWQRNPSSGIFRLTRVIVGNSPQFQE